MCISKKKLKDTIFNKIENLTDRIEYLEKFEKEKNTSFDYSLKLKEILDKYKLWDYIKIFEDFLMKRGKPYSFYKLDISKTEKNNFVVNIFNFYDDLEFTKSVDYPIGDCSYTTFYAKWLCRTRWSIRL